MNKTDLRAVFWMAFVCFAISIFVARYEIYLHPNPSDPALKSVLDWLNKNTHVSTILKLTISSTLFVGLFRSLLYLYETSSLWQFVHRRDSLNGPWIYYFDDVGIENIIYGIFSITHDMNGVVITNGRCWEKGTISPDEINQRGTWSSKKIAIGEEDFWVPYEIDITNHSKDRKEISYTGVMRFKQFIEKPLKTVTWDGTISSHNSQVDHRGRIVAKKLLRKDWKRVSWQAMPTLIEDYFGRNVSATLYNSKSQAAKQ